MKVLYNRRGVSDYALYDEAGIAEKTGVTPALYPQYAALRGDPSDNLPGVPGVGEKTAAKLINQYGGLDGIFANVDEQTPKLRDNLAEHEERARKNLELMLLRRDAPIDTVDFDALGDRAEAGRGQAAVRLPRVPHARRPARRGARPDERHRAERAARRARTPRSPTVESAAEAAALLARARRARPRRASGRASPAAARSPGSPSSPTRRCRRVAWIPAELARRPGGGRCARRRTRTCAATTSRT